MKLTQPATARRDDFGGTPVAGQRWEVRVMTEKVSTTWTVERETATRNYAKHETFTLDVDGVFTYARGCSDDPGECSLEITRVAFCGTEFTLTDAERAELVNGWTEELRS